jgi:hypothetical protein
MVEKIDKSEWGDGPWQTEPDEVTWSFGDVPCRIVRHPGHGSLNGYVAVPPSHPWYGTDMHDVDVDVHGGITFAGRFGIHVTPDVPVEDVIDEDDLDDVVSTTRTFYGAFRAGKTFASKTDNADLWWIGFDCAHFMDYMPGMVAFERSLGMHPLADIPGHPSSYKTVEYVTREVETLALEAIAAYKALK